MNKENKYFEVRNKYLAEGLAFLGFKYYKFNGQDNKTIYSFEDTKEIKDVINHLIQLKKGLNPNRSLL